MDRNAMILYLKDVRDLEFAKRKIVSMYNCEKNSYKCQKRSLDKLEYKKYINYRESDMVIAFVLAAFMFIGGVLISSIKFISGLGMLGIAGAIIVALYGFCLYLIGWSEREEVEEYNRRQREVYDNNRKKSKQLSEQWSRRYKFWCNEYDKISGMLNKIYSVNIIPEQYRNLASVYFVHQYMSTSQASLNDALLHDGIQQVLVKLDKIIEQNEILIFAQRKKEANDSCLIKQNEEMLQTLRQTERNSSVAAQYAEISANHAKANTYFMIADYLEKK